MILSTRKHFTATGRLKRRHTDSPSFCEQSLKVQFCSVQIQGELILMNPGRGTPSNLEKNAKIDITNSTDDATQYSFIRLGGRPVIQ